MIFVETSFEGAYLIKPEKAEDERGFFARTFCVREFEEKGLSTHFVQHSLSHNKKKGTLRGMHFQKKPYEETKVVQCIQGEIYDVIVDIREDSKTYMRWEAFTLNCENRHMLYIPKGFAHGFQTLKDNSEILYLVDAFYNPDFGAGLRYDDQRLHIAWPIQENMIISSRDLSYRFIEK